MSFYRTYLKARTLYLLGINAGTHTWSYCHETYKYIGRLQELQNTVCVPGAFFEKVVDRISLCAEVKALSRSQVLVASSNWVRHDLTRLCAGWPAEDRTFTILIHSSRFTSKNIAARLIFIKFVKVFGLEQIETMSLEKSEEMWLDFRNWLYQVEKWSIVTTLHIEHYL